MRTRNVFDGLGIAFLTALVVLVVASSALAQTDVRANCGNLGNPRVFPPHSKPYGLSYADWTVRWWKWAYSLPVAGHPLFEETGEDCAAGQRGNVWFLGGVFNVSGSATRDLCVVPPGKAIFFPILNVEYDNICPPGTLSVRELRGMATWYMDLATNLDCEVDGFAVKNLESYRFPADPFIVRMPEGNIFQYFGCEAAAGLQGPMVPDGIYLMLAPLSPGKHTIHFRGTVADPINFTLDITYHLTVAPAGRLAAAPAGAAASDAASADGSVPLGTAPMTTSWGRLKTIYR